jgi:thiosulfate reductase/polysulfide reductase chain A
VAVSSSVGAGRIKVLVTDMIHPEVVFMLHGFGHEAKLASRSYNKGVSDSVLQKNVSDEIGGSPALHETFVEVNLA